MFDLSPEKIVFLGVIALVVLGPERLPGFARKAGRIMAQLRQMGGSFHEEVRGALAEPRQVLDNAAQEMGLSGITGVPRVPNVRRTLTDALMGGGERDGGPDAPPVQPAIPAASAPVAPSVHFEGLPPVPDDPTLN